jgi:hypothetical protein
MATDAPMYQGIVFPAIYQYPDIPLLIGKPRVRISMRLEVDTIMPD